MPDPNIIGSLRLGPGTATLDELLTKQGAAPTSIQEMAALCASWPEDHDPDKMVAVILANRRRFYRRPLVSSSRMIWTAAIVLACILGVGLVMLLQSFSLPGSTGSLKVHAPVLSFFTKG